MTDRQLLERITIDPKVMVGKSVIKGTRLTVEHILTLPAHGATIAEIVNEYKGLIQEDIQACILFASKTLADITFMPLTVEKTQTHLIIAAFPEPKEYLCIPLCALRG